MDRIAITHYKNISEASVRLSPRMNCLIGHNGEGKTNFLDAVYYLSFCRSAYTSADSNLILHGEDFFMLNGRYITDEGEEEDIYCGMKRGAKKHFKRNKKEYKRLSAHIGLIPLIFVAPSDTAVIEGGSDERRRIMDLVVSQYDPTYIEALNRYNKALQQRNAMLRAEPEPDDALISILEEQMGAEGEIVYAGRDRFISELTPLFQAYYKRISNEKEEVSLQYTSHCQRGALADVIREGRNRDRAVGYSLHGIHRDDIDMLIGGYPVKREGSQGQCKTFAIALKLSQFELLKGINPKSTPILLLDDVFDKLDAERVEQIVRIVSGDGFGQIFVTDTNREHLDKILRGCSHDYTLFNVEKGNIKPLEAR